MAHLQPESFPLISLQSPLRRAGSLAPGASAGIRVEEQATCHRRRSLNVRIQTFLTVHLVRIAHATTESTGRVKPLTLGMLSRRSERYRVGETPVGLDRCPEMEVGESPAALGCGSCAGLLRSAMWRVRSIYAPSRREISFRRPRPRAAVWILGAPGGQGATTAVAPSE